jgi:hypothetical protein
MVDVIGNAAAMKAVLGVIRTMHSPRDQRRRIVKEAGCATLTTIGSMVGVTAG